MVNSIINLAFGDNICHPYISILGMDYFWVYHTIVFVFSAQFQFWCDSCHFSISKWCSNARRIISPQRIVVISFWMWRFPKSWGYPQIIRFIVGFFIINHPAFGVPPPLFDIIWNPPCFWVFLDVLVYLPTGWWFGTFCIFPYIGNNHPNWLILRGWNHQPANIVTVLGDVVHRIANKIARFVFVQVKTADMFCIYKYMHSYIYI